MLTKETLQMLGGVLSSRPTTESAGLDERIVALEGLVSRLTMLGRLVQQLDSDAREIIAWALEQARSTSGEEWEWWIEQAEIAAHKLSKNPHYRPLWWQVG